MNTRHRFKPFRQSRGIYWVAVDGADFGVRISTLPLMTRTLNCLSKAIYEPAMETVSDILNAGVDYLLMTPNFGRVSMQDLMAVLSAEGFIQQLLPGVEGYPCPEQQEEMLDTERRKPVSEAMAKRIAQIWGGSQSPDILPQIEKELVRRGLLMLAPGNSGREATLHPMAFVAVRKLLARQARNPKPEAP